MGSLEVGLLNPEYSRKNSVYFYLVQCPFQKFLIIDIKHEIYFASSQIVTD